MDKLFRNTYKNRPGTVKKTAAAATGDALRHLAFDNSLQANIITTASTGKIVIANNAACKLLGYSKKELITKSRADIFDIRESGFKKMLKQRTAEGHSIALVTAIKKSGKLFPCEITSAVFMDEDGIEKAITTISDRSQSILEQKKIDFEKEKIVAHDIVLAKSEQKDIDTKNKKIVADNIALVKSKQNEIDIEKEKIVAHDIVLAKSDQRKLDTQKEKIVAANIALAKSEQKEIDIKKDKIVAADIASVKSKQAKIDFKKNKLVADNIALAKSDQKMIDDKKEKIVAGNIILAQAKSNSLLAENNEWIKTIARASYDVMWDWDIVTGQVYIGDSIEEVFGYKLQNNTVSLKDLMEGLFTEEINLVNENLMKTLASGDKSWKDSYKIKRYDGSIATVTSRASIVRNREGAAIRMIGATQDVSSLQELEKKLKDQAIVHEEDREKFLLAAKLSFDVIWDWNLLTNEVFIGEGFEELFGYEIKDNKGDMIADWSNYLHPADKKAIEKELYDRLVSTATHWEHAYRVTRANGSIAKVYVRASIIRDADGKAYRMIGAIQDLSRQRELEEMLDHEIATKWMQLTAYKESFKLIFNSSPDVLYDIDLIANKVTISDAYEKEFGYKITKNMTPADVWDRHIHPGDKKAVMQSYISMLASDVTEWKYSYRFLRADNSVANVLSSRIILRDADGKAYRMIGSMLDISKQTVLEERLEQEIKLKEKQITEAAEEAKEAERSDIGRELHDNVNQLLGASKLFLDMAKRGGENSEIYISRSSEYTMLAIEEIRKLTRGLATDIIKNLGLCEAIDTISRDMMQVNLLKISRNLESFEEDSVGNKFKLNVFRIVQEQLNNIIKHAQATDVRISLVQTKNFIALSISDNGVGFDTRKKSKGIGVANIKNRSLSYNGIADFVSQPGKGCVLTVTFPVANALLNTN